MSNATRLEEEISHLRRTVEELSDVVAQHDRELATLARRLQLLMEREAEREAGAGGSVPLADRKPPHW